MLETERAPSGLTEPKGGAHSAFTQLGQGVQAKVKTNNSSCLENMLNYKKEKGHDEIYVYLPKSGHTKS